MRRVVVGIDVQAARDCPFAVLDATSRMIDAGWLSVSGLTGSVQALARRYPGVCFAIDAHRIALPAPRAWYWRNRRWQRATSMSPWPTRGNSRSALTLSAPAETRR